MFHFTKLDKKLEGNCVQLGQGYNLSSDHSHCFTIFKAGTVLIIQD